MAKTKLNLRIADVSRRGSAGGAWVSGTIAGFRFDALVFPEHAKNPEWELNNSRISKLWVQRPSEHRPVFNLDRGMDVSAASTKTQAVVDFLCARLADLIFPAEGARAKVK